MANMTSAAAKGKLFEAMVGRAILAPSSHNTQPWIFELTADRIRLFADRTRALRVNDPDDRELTISCGCALFNLRAAASEQGVNLVCATKNDPEDESFLAEARLNGAPDPALAALAAAIDKRHTHRKPIEDRPVGANLIEELTAAARAEGAWLDVLGDDSSRAAVAALIAEGDATQWANPGWRRELAAWMRSHHSGDGLTLPWPALPLVRIIVRTFNIGNVIGARDKKLAESSPLLAVLGTDGDTPEHWLKAGQALQRVLLRAVGLGLQGGFFNQPLQIAHLRPKLQALCQSSGHPQILLSLGYANEDVTPTPRRPLEAVMRREPSYRETHSL